MEVCNYIIGQDELVFKASEFSIGHKDSIHEHLGKESTKFSKKSHQNN